MNLDECEVIFEKALGAESEAAFRTAIEPLFREYEILSVVLGRGDIFWRARVIAGCDAYGNLADLDYPPPQLARVGRLNDAGSPCFYASMRRETALAEVGAKEGDHVQLAGFRVLLESPVRLVLIGEYSNVQKNGYMHFAGADPDRVISRGLNKLPREEALKRLYIDKFFAHVLSDPEASANGYRSSRALAASIYAQNQADGIVFPSVKDRGGFNIAVPAAPSDRCFHNSCCVVVRMAKPRLYGIIDYAVVKTALKLDSSLNFVWSENRGPEMIRLYNLTQEEYAKSVRARVGDADYFDILRTHVRGARSR